MDWLLICPRCACAVESFARLRAVLRQFRCPECHNEYEAAMDDFIAIYFNVSPQICAIRYHRPETLEPFDYMFQFRGVREGRRPDGVPYIDAARAALRGIGFLEPGATASFAFEAAPGAARRRQLGHRRRLRAAGRGRAQRPSRSGVRLTYRGTGYEPDEAALAPGPVGLEIANPTAQPRRGRDRCRSRRTRRTRSCASTPTSPASTCSPARPSRACSAPRWSVARRGSRSATSRSCSPTSRARPPSTSGSATSTPSSWSSSISTGCARPPSRHGGAVVKTIGDAVMAAYPDAARAVAAALDMRDAAERFNQGQPERPVSLKIGIHHGAAIAVTLNDELDYFGQTVNIASRVQAMADAAEIWITEEVWRYPGVQALLAALSGRAGHGRVPGHRAADAGDQDRWRSCDRRESGRLTQSGAKINSRWWCLAR